MFKVPPSKDLYQVPSTIIITEITEYKYAARKASWDIEGVEPVDQAGPG